MFVGFLKLSKSSEDFVRNHRNEFILLTIIALRVSREGNPYAKPPLLPGQAFIGTTENIGLTRQNIRTALKNLTTLVKLTIKPTNRGTIVTLYDSSIYDCNVSETNQQDNQLLTNSQPTANHQLTTIKKVKKDKKVKEGKELSAMEEVVNGHSRFIKPTLDELKDFCLSLELPICDAETLMDKWEGNGWKNGNAPIKDWRATIRQWKRRGFLPFEKKPINGYHKNGGHLQKTLDDLKIKFQTASEDDKPKIREEYERLKGQFTTA